MVSVGRLCSVLVGFMFSACCGLYVFRVFSMLWASGLMSNILWVQVFTVFRMLWVSGVQSVQNAMGFRCSGVHHAVGFRC